MKNKDFFLNRCLDSIRSQSFQDYEIVITDRGRMAENTNKGIRQANGELIKILFMDDYFTHEYSLEEMIRNFKEYWMIVGTNNNLTPFYTSDIETGNNRLGSPSALMFKNKDPLFFDENMSWLLDCDLYKRLYEKYGEPQILKGNYITLGVGDHQMTHILTDEEKLLEHKYMQKKYGKKKN